MMKFVVILPDAKRFERITDCRNALLWFRPRMMYVFSASSMRLIAVARSSPHVTSLQIIGS